uniref:Uncharacterized protein n=1 Tax=Arundo donax TaxID=35708 RepID=A0A0A8YS75_ARUDO
MLFFYVIGVNMMAVALGGK